MQTKDHKGNNWVIFVPKLKELLSMAKVLLC